MATETLTCEDCGQDWERELKRGRKPKTCPDCKNNTTTTKTKPKPRPTKPVADPETLNKAEKKYKQRVQMQGKYFKALGEGSPFKTAGGMLTIYKAFELDDGVVNKGGQVREKGMRGTYKFLSLAVREDGTAYANLIGISGTYQGKHRAIGVENLRL